MKVVGGFMVFCWRFLVFCRRKFLAFVGGFLFLVEGFLLEVSWRNRTLYHLWISVCWDNLTSDLSKFSIFLHILFSRLSRKYPEFLFQCGKYNYNPSVRKLFLLKITNSWKKVCHYRISSWAKSVAFYDCYPWLRSILVDFWVNCHVKILTKHTL